MNKYKIGLLIFIGCIQILYASDDAEIFDYVSSRDEIAVLSMIEADFNAFNNLGLHVIDNNVIGWQGQMYNIKVVRNNECTIGAIFYTSFFDFNYPCWEVCFLVVDELYRNQGYGSLMMKSVINEMKESTRDSVCSLAPLAGLSACSGLEDDFDVLKFLSSLNYDITYKSQYIIYLDLNSDAIFSQACRKLDIEKIKKCIAEGININQQYLFKDVPYHACVVSWDLKSPLCFAIENNNSELVEIFINAGANVAGICYGTTPLRIAVNQCNSDIVSLLIKAGCDVNELDDYDRSLLCLAIYGRQDIEITKILVEAGADIYGKSHFGMSLLEYTMTINNPEFFLTLLQAGYDVESQNFDGFTLLHKAVRCICDLVIFDALLAAGVDINTTHINGLTALDYVEEMLNERRSKSFSGYRLQNEIDQLEKIKAHLLLHAY